VRDCVTTGNSITCSVEQHALDDFVAALRRDRVVLPAQPMAWTPTLALLGSAFVIGGAGFAQYRRRDLATP